MSPADPKCARCGSPAPADKITRCYRCGNMVNTIQRALPGQAVSKRDAGARKRRKRPSPAIAAAVAVFVTIVASLVVLLGSEKPASAAEKICDNRCDIDCRVDCLNP